MSRKFNLDKAINVWARNFHKHRAYDQGTLHEMELHLRDHIEDLMSEGFSEKEAFDKAVSSFGEISEIATEEYSNIQRKITLKTILFKTMLKSYFKTTLRNMMRNPMSSLINLFGLAIAIGACMVTYAFIDHDYSLDRFHENKDNLYLTTINLDRGDKLVTYGTTPAPLGRMLEDDFGAIEQSCRIETSSAVVRVEDRVFNEQIHYVDPSYLELFTFPLKWGVSKSLNETNTIILSNDMSIKYFGEENPVGQSLKVLFGADQSKVFKVAGVAKPFPEARIIDFDFLVNIENVQFSKPEYSFQNWQQEMKATFVQVKNPKDLATITANMEKYKNAYNSVEPDWPIESFSFVSLHDLHLASGKIRNDISYDSSSQGRISLPIIAGFLLIIACFNYINIAIVSGTRRLKEIGLRKVVGANRRLVIFQFFAENLVQTAIAALIGFLFAIIVILPWFASFAPVTNQFDLTDPNMWLFLAIILMVTALLSGLYPAYYISKFQAVNIFRGSLKFGRKNVLTKVFLTLQLALTCVGIAFAVMLAKNSNFQSKRSWGYEKEQVLYAYVPDYATYSQLQKVLLEHPKVLAVAGAENHFSISQKSVTVHLPARQIGAKEMAVGEDYLESLGLSLKEGRYLMEEGRLDKDKVLVNEEMVRMLELDKPVGQKIRIGEQSMEIVGVLANAHFYNFYYEIDPTIFTVSDKENYRYLTVKVDEANRIEVLEDLKSYSAKLYPDMPFLGGFQEDLWEGFYLQLETQERFSRVIAILFIMLSSLGLYGLIQLNLAGRIREFSVRKTLGASKKHIATKIFGQYRLIFAISILMGVPLGYYMNTALLDMLYPGPRPSGYSGAVLAAFILLIVLFSIVLSQVNKVIRRNPVDGLKVE